MANKENLREAFIQKYQALGWTLDRWGNLKKADARIKLNKISVRYEKKVGDRWVKLRGAYYSELAKWLHKCETCNKDVFPIQDGENFICPNCQAKNEKLAKKVR